MIKKILLSSVQAKSSFWRRLLFFFFPPRCVSCGEIGFGLLCPCCQQELKEDFSPKKFLAFGGNAYADTMMSLFSYQSHPAQKLILLWKRMDHPELSLIFLPYMEKAYQKQGLKKAPLVTFLPRRNEAKWMRGFDQAEKIATAVSQRMEISLEKLLFRRGHSKQQHSLPREKREANVAGVFRPTRKLEGETVLLVDDIVTSGASTKEAARVLKKAGAQKVFVFTLSH